MRAPLVVLLCDDDASVRGAALKFWNEALPRCVLGSWGGTPTLQVSACQAAAAARAVHRRRARTGCRPLYPTLSSDVILDLLL